MNINHLPKKEDWEIFEKLIKKIIENYGNLTPENCYDLILIANHRCYGKLHPKEYCWEQSSYPDCANECLTDILIDAGVKIEEERS